ncbi:unnamed protein product [Rotaria sp. Silwood1]|nr:unnamed protein product [Rotaria sp. Silwood1]CAF3760335.1 unnamed protein product [Rotaria sp. Silwood1]CAF3955976.1 unnamed protein product [Rotaria sp. Silwood1]CAF3969924.1 unnamed protein product [Rotaria sp. Silwood1]CAF4859671.1 unnamed protein product [Rotaria sp. Silwood1]
MAESNVEHNLKEDFVEKCRTDVGHQHPIIILDDRKDKKKIYEQVYAEYSRISKRPAHIFDNADECYDFVTTELCNNIHTKALVLVRDKLINDIIKDIVSSDQIHNIIILNDNPPSKEERESMKNYSKVRE